MARTKKIDAEIKAPTGKSGAFSFDSVQDSVEKGMIQSAMEAKCLSIGDIQTARVRGLDQNGNRMVIITTKEDVRIRYPIAAMDVAGLDSED